MSELHLLPSGVTAGRLSRGLLTNLTSRVCEVLLRTWCASWRKNVSQLDRLDQLLAGNERVLVAFWHGEYFPLFALAEGRTVTVLAAPSFRGEVIAKLCRRFGYEAAMIPVQEAAHAHSVRSLLSAKKAVALAVDGPLGPFHQVKPSLTRLASDMQFLIVPVSVASRPKLVLRRWDFRELPYPFAKVALSVGEPIRIPASVGLHVSTDWASVVRKALLVVDDDAEGRLQQ